MENRRPEEERVEPVESGKDRPQKERSNHSLSVLTSIKVGTGSGSGSASGTGSGSKGG